MECRFNNNVWHRKLFSYCEEQINVTQFSRCLFLFCFVFCVSLWDLLSPFVVVLISGIVDTTPREFGGCPDNMQATTELGSTTKSIACIGPTVTNLSGIQESTQLPHQPGEKYTFTDGSNSTDKYTLSNTGNRFLYFAHKYWRLSHTWISDSGDDYVPRVE